MKKFNLAVLAATISTGVGAGELAKPGFSGELMAMAGFSSTESNFNTETESKVGLLNTEAESQTEAILAPLGQIRYTFGRSSHHQVFLGTSREDIAVGDFVLEAGYKFGLGTNSSIAASYLPSVAGETWKDPFVTGKREVTDISSSAVRLKYENILDSAFSVDLGYYTSEVNGENSGASLNSGSAINQLDRDGNGLYAKFSYTHSLNQTSIIEPSFTYKSFSADGEAMSNNVYGTELSYKKFTKRHLFALSASYSKTNYDSENVVFGKTQNNNTYDVFAAYEYDKFMGWENWALNGIAGYEVTSSNINFYNEKELMLGVGMSYKF